MVIAEREFIPFREPANTCPKCSNTMRNAYADQEPECWMCGYVDYSFVPRVERTKSILATGTKYLVRYIGGFPKMKERLVEIQAVRGTGVAKIRHNTTCPFCGMNMEAVALSIKRKQISEDRYICPDGHRISLLQGQNGDIGWK